MKTAQHNKISRIAKTSRFWRDTNEPGGANSLGQDPVHTKFCLNIFPEYFFYTVFSKKTMKRSGGTNHALVAYRWFYEELETCAQDPKLMKLLLFPKTQQHEADPWYASCPRARRRRRHVILSRK